MSTVESELMRKTESEKGSERKKGNYGGYFSQFRLIRESKLVGGTGNWDLVSSLAVWVNFTDLGATFQTNVWPLPAQDEPAIQG